MMRGRSRSIRFFTLVMLFLASSTASTTEFTAIGPSSFTVSEGDTFTIDIAVANTSATSVTALAAQLTGLAAAGLTVVGGRSALHHFVAICLSPWGCLGAIDVPHSMLWNPFNLAVGFYTPGDDCVEILMALALPATTQTGAADPDLHADISDASIPHQAPRAVQKKVLDRAEAPGAEYEGSRPGNNRQRR